MSDDQIHQLRKLANANDPTDAARERMSAELDRHIARASRTAPTKWSWQLPRIAAGTTVAVAAVIACVFALSPSDSRTDHHRFTGPDTAAAHALVNAGEAAADARWTPLGANGYFHVYSTSFQLTGSVPEGFGDRGPSTYEVWLRRDGSGQGIYVSGGEYPQRFMHIGYNKKTGEIMNVGGSSLPKGPRVSEPVALRNPDEVSLMTWPRDDSPGNQFAWLRQPSGYKPTFTGPNSASQVKGYTAGDLRLRETWGVTLEELDHIPKTSGSDLDAAIQQLLTASPDGRFMGGRLATGAYGLTQADIDREQQIRLATTLLGGAPLAPNARRATFRWLAQQPGATLKRGVRDRIGRVGNRVTFSSSYDHQVKGRRVTVQTILDEATAAGARGIKPTTVVRLLDTSTKPIRKSIDRAAKVNLPAHREQRTWKVELIIDPNTGELLQYSTSEQSKTTGQVPELSLERNGGLHLYVQGGGSNGFGGGGSIYRKRESVPTIKPLSPVCGRHPELCGPPK